jgi:hypothetical protein
VDQQWRLRRAAAIENALMGMMDPEGPEEIEIDTGVVRELATLQIYVQRIQRVLKEVQKQLHDMQVARQFRENRQTASALAIYELRLKQDMPWDPREYGFDCSLVELQAHIKRGGMARFAHMAAQFDWNTAKMEAFLDEICGKEVA